MQKHWKDALTLATLSSVGPFAASCYLPSLTLIRDDLGISMVGVQQTLTFYLVFFASFSLLTGSLSDVIGRKKVLVGGSLVFAFASLGASLSTNLVTLIFWRILQGVAAACGPVVTQAVIRDKYKGVQAARMIALLAVLFALAPAIAPIIGGEIAHSFGWRAVFIFLAIFNLGLASVGIFVLKESLPKEKRVSFRPTETLKGFSLLFHNKAFMCGVVAHAFCFLGGILYTAGSSDFVVHILHKGIDDFGYLIIPLVAITIPGSALAPKFYVRFGGHKAILICATLMIVSGIWGATINEPEAAQYPEILIPILLYNFAMSVARPSMNVMNLDYYPDRKGMAASVQQFLQTLAFAISSGLVVPLVLGDAAKYAWVMAICGVLVFVLWIVVSKTRQKYLP